MRPKKKVRLQAANEALAKCFNDRQLRKSVAIVDE